jgi:formylglycine-generating enzyme required for sulfatase activity
MIASILSLAVALTGPTTLAVTIPTVPIGNPGDPADTRYIDSYHPNGVGSVAYPFQIGKTEVTNAQYVVFLNAVAAADPYGLYSTAMGSETQGGIIRFGAAGSFTYQVKAAAQSGAYLYDDKPVVFVSSVDAMRFANWLHNDQPSGPQNASTTEDGAYTLNGAVTNAALAAVTRNSGAQWWLPSEDEWYKAAYHNNDGVTGNYWDYPTGTDSAPDNNLPSSDSGNSANFGHATGSEEYPLTNAGAYTLSGSPYGTFDQGGNVWEWNETLFDGVRSPRGGGWSSDIELYASFIYSYHPTVATYEDWMLGFRVASAVPEPASAVLLAIATVSGLFLRRAPIS